MQDDRVTYAGEPVAVVVADTWERATFAASLVAVTYHADRPRVDLAAERHAAFAPANVWGDQTDSRRGDPDAAFPCRAGDGRRDVRHAGHAPRDDGAARDDGRLGRWRPRHRVRAEHVGVRRAEGRRDVVRAQAAAGAGGAALRRRQLRVQGADVAARGDRRRRRPARRPPGAAGADAGPDVHRQRLPPANRPRRQVGRDARRPADGAPIRRHRPDVRLRRPRRRPHHPHAAAAVRRPQPVDVVPPGRPEPVRPVHDARPRRGPGPVRRRVCDGRTGHHIGHGPGRAADRQPRRRRPRGGASRGRASTCWSATGRRPSGSAGRAAPSTPGPPATATTGSAPAWRP